MISEIKPLNFPELIYLNDFEGNFDAYFKAVYNIFESDFMKSQPNYCGLKVTAPRYPEVDGVSRTFYHITHEGEDEKNRTPNFRRMERIRFPKYLIMNCPHDEILIWEKEIRGDLRTHLLNKEEKYLVVLNKRKDYLMLWTAFYIDQDHTIRKKIKEYEAYIKAKTA